MLQPLTSLNLLSRREVTPEAWLLESGNTGTFVEINSGTAKKPTAGNMAFPVWTESYRDGTSNWSPDQAAAGTVTVLYGKLVALTDNYEGTPTVGAKLYVNSTGKLTTTSAGNAVVLAFCTKAPHTYDHLGKRFTVIEFTLV